MPSCPRYRQLFAKMCQWRATLDLHQHRPHRRSPLESRAGLTELKVPADTNTRSHGSRTPHMQTHACLQTHAHPSKHWHSQKRLLRARVSARVPAESRPQPALGSLLRSYLHTCILVTCSHHTCPHSQE
uniref:Uncharacterized protein n=1 Tax=Molossus molossus TaxID=27622 RepID=A0A7J8ERI5_MOLMO|nr:hypothetical protein HJG59_008713 [Molossus molossus]